MAGLLAHWGDWVILGGVGIGVFLGIMAIGLFVEWYKGFPNWPMRPWG